MAPALLFDAVMTTFRGLAPVLASTIVLLAAPRAASASPFGSSTSSGTASQHAARLQSEAATRGGGLRVGPLKVYVNRKSEQSIDGTSGKTTISSRTVGVAWNERGYLKTRFRSTTTGGGAMEKSFGKVMLRGSELTTSSRTDGRTANGIGWFKTQNERLEPSSTRQSWAHTVGGRVTKGSHTQVGEVSQTMTSTRDFGKEQTTSTTTTVTPAGVKTQSVTVPTPNPR